MQASKCWPVLETASAFSKEAKPAKVVTRICTLHLNTGCCAVENLRLAQEVQRLQQDIETEELERLGEDVAGLRDELLAQGDQVKRLQSTPTVST